MSHWGHGARIEATARAPAYVEAQRLFDSPARLGLRNYSKSNGMADL